MSMPAPIACHAEPSQLAILLAASPPALANRPAARRDPFSPERTHTQQGRAKVLGLMPEPSVCQEDPAKTEIRAAAWPSACVKTPPTTSCPFQTASALTEPSKPPASG